MTKHQKRRAAAHRERRRQERIQNKAVRLEGAALDDFLNQGAGNGLSNRDFLREMGVEPGSICGFDLGDGACEFEFPG